MNSSDNGSVLVVDDDADVRFMLEEFANDMGYRIQLASDGARALDLLSQQPFDVVITDFKMPVMNGIELMAKARARNIETPFLVITGHGGEGVMLDALRLGAVDFVAKPFDLNELSRTLTRIIALSRAKQEIQQIIGELVSVVKAPELLERLEALRFRINLVLVTSHNAKPRNDVPRPKLTGSSKV